MESGVIVVPAGVEKVSLRANIHTPLSGEEEPSGDADVEGSKAKASLPPFVPLWGLELMRS